MQARCTPDRGLAAEMGLNVGEQSSRCVGDDYRGVGDGTCQVA